MCLETRKEKANIQTLTQWRRKRMKRKHYMDTVSYENNCKQVSEYTRKKIKVGQERAVNWLYRVTSARGGKA